jgi:hypothetical protein
MTSRAGRLRGGRQPFVHGVGVKLITRSISRRVECKRGVGFLRPRCAGLVHLSRIESDTMILESPPHTIILFVEETVTDSYGNPLRRPSSTSVEVRCLVMPVASQVRERADQRPPRRYKVLVRDAPLTLFSRVIVNNVSHSVESVIGRHDSPTTRHIEAVIREEV